MLKRAGWERNLLTSVEMNSNNTVLNDIHYTYVGRAFSGSSATIGGTNGTTIGPGYYKVRYENVLLECRFESNWDFDDTHFAITNALSNVLDTQWVILGDVNRDENRRYGRLSAHPAVFNRPDQLSQRASAEGCRRQ